MGIIQQEEGDPHGLRKMYIRKKEYKFLQCLKKLIFYYSKCCFEKFPFSFQELE